MSVPTATQLDLPTGSRQPVPCPVCHRPHRLTLDGLLWTHGPKADRCRGSRQNVPSARVAARFVRPVLREQPPLFGGAR